MNDYSEIIVRAAAKHGVDPELIRRVIEAESNNDPAAVSPKGAQGLMQLMPDTAKEMGVTDPNDPEQNIMGGTQYLSGLRKRFGTDEKAAAAYNWGPTNVAGGGAYPPETTAYLKKVLGGYTPPAPAMPTPGPTTPPGPPPSAPTVASNAVPPVAPKRPYPQPAPPPPALVDQAAPGTAAPPPPTRTASAEPQEEMYRPMGPVGPSFPKALVDRGRGAFNRVVSGAKTAMAPMMGPAPVQAAPKDFPLDYAGDNERMPPEAPPTAAAAPSPTVPMQPKSSAMDMLMEYIKGAPRREDYKQGTLGKIAGVAASGLAGALEGSESAMRTADWMANGKYDRAVRDHAAQYPGIALAARTEDQNFDRSLKEREVNSIEKYHDTMGAAATERADKYGTGRGKTGPQQRVPVGQQGQAWQMAAERLYVTDPTVRKYLTKIEGKNGPSYVPATEVERTGWWNRDFNPQELEEVRKVLDRIDQEAQQFTGKMVDPYDRSHPSGFGAQE